MGIEFGNTNRIDSRKIEEAMELIRRWIKPDELKYDEKLGCLSLVWSWSGGYRHLDIFEIISIDIDTDPITRMMTIRTSGGSTIFIHESGSIASMIH